MNNSNSTFGVRFVLRNNKVDSEGKFPIYARITVNGSRAEISLKKYVEKSDWDSGKGVLRSKTREAKEFNTWLQEVQGKIVRHYRELRLADGPPTAAMVKEAFNGIRKDPDKGHTLLWLMQQHNTQMQKILKQGSLKNYFTTEKYLKAFLSQQYKKTDIGLKQLNYAFIASFEIFIRSNPLKGNDPCTTNGTMKHLERLKKIVTWAFKNEWIIKDPFINFHLKFKHTEREFLTELEVSAIQAQELENPMLRRVRDYFVFSCYTGLSYIDLMELRLKHILTGIDGVRWIKTIRAKTDIAVNVPLLRPAEQILEKFTSRSETEQRETVFPRVTNQEINRSLKVIAEICGIRKYLTFHLARHTFATTITLMNGVPIETISRMLGHTKLSTTMIYAKVNPVKIGMDMEVLQRKLDKNQGKGNLTAVR